MAEVNHQDVINRLLEINKQLTYENVLLRIALEQVEAEQASYAEQDTESKDD